MRALSYFLGLTLLIAVSSCAPSIARFSIDTFEDVSAWTPHPADGVELSILPEPGDNGG